MQFLEFLVASVVLIIILVVVVFLLLSWGPMWLILFLIVAVIFTLRR